MLILGIDVGGTNVRGAVADETGEVISFTEAKTPVQAVEPLLEVVVAIANDLQSETGDSIRAAAIGFPGLVDFTSGVVRYSPNLPAFKNVQFSKMVSQRLDIDVYLANDANLAAMGERWLGVGRDITNFAFITLGTGVGSGLIINGRPFWGGSGYSAELGHLKVEPDGALCPCGDRGCLEAYCSASGLCARAVEAKRRGEKSIMWETGAECDSLDGQAVDDAASKGDALACRLLTEAGKYLGQALAALRDLVGIEAAIIGGRMANMKFDILEMAQDEANQRAITARVSRITVLRSSLGDKAGCLGAIRYALDRHNG
ncbi:MAG: ROK family protein [Candidatus Coatesbacteria bacterium]|nr:ROK family protein [Candidatus Coatesbacteria bacterium]